jgi:uncharacterized protein
LFLVDTNILLYAAVEETEEHEKAAELVQAWRSGDASWCATWPILYEFLRVITHPSVFERPVKASEALRFLQGILESPPFSVLVETPRHHDVLVELARTHPKVSGNLVHDFHTVVLMKEHGVSEIQTADTDFYQFKFLRVTNPFRP